MKPGKIRPLAICVFQRGDKIFVAEGYDEIKRQTFFRPIGGKIEFGELGHETIAREVDEEIGQAVTNLRYLGTLENIFTYNGQKGHEIVRIYDGEFVDHAMYEAESVEGHDDNELLFRAVWKSLDFFRDGNAPLYPDGLLELLNG